MTPLRRLAMPLAALLLGAAALPAFAQAGYPDHPIRFIVGYPPGQSVDIVARTFAAAMSADLGQTIVVENKPGANGILGAQDVKGARPDGYTALVGTSGQLTINPSLYRKLPYDTLKDFAAVGMLGRAPTIIIANPAFPANSIPELAALARARPGKIDFASGGSGITAHLAMELLQEQVGIKLNHIPYKGSPAALNDVIGGQVPLMAENVVAALPHIKAGKVKALGLLSQHRYPSLPDVPTLGEQGLKDLEVTAWSAVVVPAGTPPAIVNRLNAALRKAAQSPAAIRTLQAAGIHDTDTLSPAEFHALLEAETKMWAGAVQKSGAQVD